jgi:hypothetical protein
MRCCVGSWRSSRRHVTSVGTCAVVTQLWMSHADAAWWTQTAEAGSAGRPQGGVVEGVVSHVGCCISVVYDDTEGGECLSGMPVSRCCGTDLTLPSLKRRVSSGRRQGGRSRTSTVARLLRCWTRVTVQSKIELSHARFIFLIIFVIYYYSSFFSSLSSILNNFLHSLFLSVNFVIQSHTVFRYNSSLYFLIKFGSLYLG